MKMLPMWKCANTQYPVSINQYPMRSKSSWILVVGCWLFAHCAAFGGNAVNPDAIELAPLPMPVEFRSDMDASVPFDRDTVVTVDCPDASAAAWLATHFADWYGDYAPKAKAGASGLSLPAGEEAYAAKADASGVKIAARSLAGVRWAAYSIRQLAIAKRGTFKTQGRILPTLSISDSPRMAFRCVHLCWFPETRPAEVERALRLAALLKFNYAIVEPWGTYMSEKNPWWPWPGSSMTKAEVRRLAALGKDLGITLIPILNVYGHASSARTISMKHCVLDMNPEYEPLFEPGGWNWCLTNPETQRVLREIIVEMMEDFGNPPFFHLGCDEAQPPTCPACRRVPYGELVCRHITDLAAFVKERGARAMIWHDMLLLKSDKRWKWWVANGTKDTVKLADTLPKDVVVCDWQYDKHEKVRDWPTLAHLIGKGFPVVTCPNANVESMGPMADFIAENNGFGFMLTTWLEMHGRKWSQMFRHASAAAWGTPVRGKGKFGATPQHDVEFSNALRMIGNDMKVKDYRDTGVMNLQRSADWL